MSAALLTLSACGGSDSSGESETLPDVELIGVGETTVTTSSWVGEPLVINFWFSTCIPCATELVDFAEVDAARGDEVRFVGVNPNDLTSISPFIFHTHSRDHKPRRSPEPRCRLIEIESSVLRILAVLRFAVIEDNL